MITRAGVVVDNSKLQAMLDWPTPKSIKELRGSSVLLVIIESLCMDMGK